MENSRAVIPRSIIARVLVLIGIDPGDVLLGNNHDCARFPRDEGWITSRRCELLARIAR